HHFTAHIAGGADDGHTVPHRITPLSLKERPERYASIALGARQGWLIRLASVSAWHWCRAQQPTRRIFDDDSVIIARLAFRGFAPAVLIF
ncbi:MAG: hypothetical protein RJA87_2492, partial [Pseudomonadota bacterium]